MSTKITLGFVVTLFSLGMLFSFWRNPTKKPEHVELLDTWRKEFGLIPYLFVFVLPFFSIGLMQILTAFHPQSSFLMPAMVVLCAFSAMYLGYLYTTKKHILFAATVAVKKAMSSIKGAGIFYVVAGAWNLFKKKPYLTADIVEAFVYILVGAILIRSGYGMLKSARESAPDSASASFNKQRQAPITIVFGILVALWGMGLFVKGAQPANQLNSKLRAAASKTNQQLPVMIDTVTRFDEVQAWDQELVFYYTLTTYRQADIDIRNFTAKMSKAALEALCKNPQVNSLLAQGALITLRYRSKDQAVVANIVIEPSQCGHPETDELHMHAHERAVMRRGIELMEQEKGRAATRK